MKRRLQPMPLAPKNEIRAAMVAQAAEVNRLAAELADYKHGAHHEAEAGDEARAANERFRTALEDVLDAIAQPCGCVPEKLCAAHQIIFRALGTRRER
jgi:hypothetical protein